ncbi:MAG: hypothetical protein ACRCYU_02480 [Nocardioides sp.]
MANPQKSKGDRGEREAKKWLLTHARPQDLAARPQRELGAGRTDDKGDLRVLVDACIQVKNFDLPHLAKAVREAAVKAAHQSVNAETRFHCGMSKVAGARSGPVWLASSLNWPTPPALTVDFKAPALALAWTLDDRGPYGYPALRREHRVAIVAMAGTDPFYVAPFEAWLHAYETAMRGGVLASCRSCGASAAHGSELRLEADAIRRGELATVPLDDIMLDTAV